MNSTVVKNFSISTDGVYVVTNDDRELILQLPNCGDSQHWDATKNIPFNDNEEVNALQEQIENMIHPEDRTIARLSFACGHIVSKYIETDDGLFLTSAGDALKKSPYSSYYNEEMYEIV